MTHGYPIGMGDPESPKGPLGAGCWSDIMAAPVGGNDPAPGEAPESSEPEPPHPPPDACLDTGCFPPESELHRFDGRNRRAGADAVEG